MSKKIKGLATTSQVRLYPATEQSRLLMAHCTEYISTVNALVQAIDADMLEEGFSTKDFTAALPSAVKNQVLRDARSVYKRSLELGVIPVLKKPMCQWNNQNWQLKNGFLLIPLYVDGKVQQVPIACAEIQLEGVAGILRVKKKRGKWIADVTMMTPAPEPSAEQGVMGVDLGIKLPRRCLRSGQGNALLWQWPLSEIYASSLLCPSQEAPKGWQDTRCQEEQGQRSMLDEAYQSSVIPSDCQSCR